MDLKNKAISLIDFSAACLRPQLTCCIFRPRCTWRSSRRSASLANRRIGLYSVLRRDVSNRKSKHIRFLLFNSYVLCTSLLTSVNLLSHRRMNISFLVFFSWRYDSMRRLKSTGLMSQLHRGCQKKLFHHARAR